MVIANETKLTITESQYDNKVFGIITSVML